MKILDIFENNEKCIPSGLTVLFRGYPIGVTTGEIIDSGLEEIRVVYESDRARRLCAINLGGDVTVTESEKNTTHFLLEGDVIKALPAGYGTDAEDQSTLKLNDTRKTRLTLEQLNKLRIINDIRQLEFEKQVEKVSKIYKPAASSQSGGF